MDLFNINESKIIECSECGCRIIIDQHIIETVRKHLKRTRSKKTRKKPIKEPSNVKTVNITPNGFMINFD